MNDTTKELFRLVLFHRWPHRLLIILFSFLSAFCGLLAPWFQKEFIDQLTHHETRMHLDWFTSPAPWILLAFLAMLIAQAFNQATNYMGAREAIAMQRLLAQRLYDRMLDLRSDTMSSRPLGEVVALYATDVQGATVFLDQTLPMGATTLFPLILAPFALTLLFDAPLWPTVSIMAAITLLNTALAFRQSKFFYNFKQLAAVRTGLVNEWIQNIRTLRILGWTTAFEKRIFEKREIETENRVSMVTNGQVMNSISTSVTFLINVATLATLTIWANQKLSAGEMLALFWITGVFLTRPFRQMPWFFTFAFDAWTSLKRLGEFMDTANNQTPQPPADPVKPLAPSQAALEVRGLRLEVRENILLKNIDLRVNAGEFVAIVGEVGSGKSLLLLSLLRETGAAFEHYSLHGRDALHMTDFDLRSTFGFVPQEGFIMSATLRDNVIFDYDNGPEHDTSVRASLTTSDFDLSRERTDNGLETEIGERGVNLSGGQKQRVSLARVHYANPKIILLDDCLSAVDVDTETKLVEQLLRGAWNGRTRLLVTHRLSVLEHVDRIIFLKDGEIFAQGSLRELLDTSPEFREFSHSMEKLKKGGERGVSP